MNESGTAVLILFAIQLGLLFLIVKFFGHIGKKTGVPAFICQLLAGVIMGPSAMGGITLPGFTKGLFYLSNEWYIFALLAITVFFFAFGLAANIGLFFRYSLAGSIIGFTGAVFSFLFGNLAACILLDLNFFSLECLFAGILFMATSSCLPAKILSKNKKMNSPEGVAVLTSAVFDNIFGIIIFALALAAGIILFAGSMNPGLRNVNGLLFFAITISGVLLGAIILGFVASGYRAAAVVYKRVQGVYNFFVPLLFAIAGMMVNIRELFSPGVLIFGVIFSLAAVLAKTAGCGGSALLLGFNPRGSLRIASAMIPRGEFVIVVAGIGLAMGVIEQQLFGAVILMIIITNLAAAPLLNISLKLAGPGTRRPVKGDDQVSAAWNFSYPEIAGLVLDMLLKELKDEDFYIRKMDGQNNLIQARKSDIALSLAQEGKTLSIEASRVDIAYVKAAVSKIINSLYEPFQKLNESLDTRNLGNKPGGEDKSGKDIFSQISPDCISVKLKGSTKKEIITELVDILANQRRLLNRDLVLNAILEREKVMSTGMQRGLALPHAKTDGVTALTAAIGIKKEGMDFGSIDGEKTRLFILVVSPQNTSGPHVQFLASISAVLKDDTLREAVINAATPEEVLRLLN